MTFADFVTKVKATVFPEGEAENLVAIHRKYIVDALVDLQQKIPSLRTRHEDHTLQEDTFFECGATVLSAPRGFIAKIWTITNESCCAKVYYDPVSEGEMQCRLTDKYDCGVKYTPYNMYELDGEYVYYPDYPGCLYYADSSGTTDKPTRSFSGIVSLIGGNLYLYPHIQANEIVVVEWDGIKRSWNDSDTVNWDREIEDAVELYLEQKTSRREDCDLNKTVGARSEYADLVAKLIWQYKNERRIPQREHCFTNCGPLPSCD